MSANKLTAEQRDKILSVFDTVGKSGGVYVARRGFFYPNGQTAGQLADDLRACVPAANVVETGEVWRPFRGGASVAASSHWFVKFTV